MPVKEIVLRGGALDDLPELTRRHRLRREALVVADPTTFAVCGEDVVAHLRDVCPARVAVLGEKGELEANEETVALPLDHMTEHTGFMIAVGSGTVSDIVKYASTQAGVPYIVVPTAPSMNGYTSSVVAMMRNGLKVTVPATPPVAVVGDLDVLCDAPPAMIGAGLGDIISKWTSNADWQLAHWVKSQYFCPVPFSLIQDIEPQYLDRPAALAAPSPDAVAALTEALLYSGISMIIAGSSSPASGAEHLISHTLDMRAPMVGRKAELHGAQVGVATIFVAALYERLCGWDPASLDVSDVQARLPGPVQSERDIRAFFGGFADGVIEEFQHKRLSWDGKRTELESVFGRWDEILQGIRPYLKPSAQIRCILSDAGAPTKASDLGLSSQEFLDTVVHAHQIRNRYTILDLAGDIGLLPDAAEEAAVASGTL